MNVYFLKLLFDYSMENPLYNGSKRCSRGVKPPATMCSAPQDVIIYMLGFLNVLDICRTAMLVNKQFERLSRQAMLKMEVVDTRRRRHVSVSSDNEEFWGGFGRMMLKLHKTLKKIKGDHEFFWVGWKQLFIAFFFLIYISKLCYFFFFSSIIDGFHFSLVSWACISYVN